MRTMTISSNSWFQIKFNDMHPSINGWFYTKQSLTEQQITDYINQIKQEFLDKLHIIATTDVISILEKERKNYHEKWENDLSQLFYDRQYLDTFTRQEHPNLLSQKRKATNMIKTKMHEFYRTQLVIFNKFSQFSINPKELSLPVELLSTWQEYNSHQFDIDFYNYLEYSPYWNKNKQFVDALYDITEYQKHTTDIQNQLLSDYPKIWINDIGIDYK